MLYLYHILIFIYKVAFSESHVFHRVQNAVLSEQNLHIINSNTGITSTIMCACKCILLGDRCVTYSFTEHDTECITYSQLIISEAQAPVNSTMYMAKPGFRWVLSVYIDTRPGSESPNTLYMDVKGTKFNVSDVVLGGNFVNGETRERIYGGYLGKISNIRLYQKGSDGIYVLTVTMEADSGDLYTFICNCWIQTDEPADDSEPSWLLWPEIIN
ncbi:uncharacterized protein [Argopecten irradians]|uniref:uncharacterized protein n=1 Tax=Argopecten irradians TaxID=31199 RepID=UPI00371741F8